MIASTRLSQEITKITPQPITLTAQQAKAISKLVEFIDFPEKAFGLYGYAGVGKSTCIFELIKILQQRGKRIAMVAPTNKALGVLRKIAHKNGVTGVTFLTIHSLLGLAPVRQGAEKVLKQVMPDSLQMFDFIICDECSMIGKPLWEIMVEKIVGSLFNKKLIVMGDPAQLPPVSEDGGENEKKSLSFSLENKAVLTEVVRQAEASPLLKFITACRKAVRTKEVFKPFSIHSEDKNNGALIVKEATLLKYAFKKFLSEFDTNPDCLRILCYTNKCVEKWNSQIRAFIYGENAPKFVEGERLIAKKPILGPDGKTTILQTSAEFEVLEVTVDRYAGYKAWCLKIKTETGETRQIFVLHEDDAQKYESDNQRLLKNAKQNPSLWKGWYEHNDLFADIRNCWALTVHNSQGSTFSEVAIDKRDITTKSWGKNGSIRECNQLWYVSTSRASNRVFIVR